MIIAIFILRVNKKDNIKIADMTDSFEKKFEKLVEKNFKSKKECARLLGVSDTAVNSTIKGTSTPNIKLIIKLAKITGVSLDWLLLEEEGDEKQEKFKLNLAENLKKNINYHFKNRDYFADSINEKSNIVDMWCMGENLPNLYKLYEICEKMGITIDFLIKDKKPDLSDIDINYDIFDEVILLVNEYAKKYKIKKITSEEYLNMYHAISKMKEISLKRISIKESFEIYEPLLLSHLRKIPIYE